MEVFSIQFLVQVIGNLILAVMATLFYAGRRHQPRHWITMIALVFAIGWWVNTLLAIILHFVHL